MSLILGEPQPKGLPEETGSEQITVNKQHDNHRNGVIYDRNQVSRRLSESWQLENDWYLHNASVKSEEMKELIHKLRRCKLLAEKPAVSKDLQSLMAEACCSSDLGPFASDEPMFGHSKPALIKVVLGPNSDGVYSIVPYKDESEMDVIMQLITKDLSEPYSIYTYRYFIHNWPQLCFLARDCASGECVGAIVCKLDETYSLPRGYIAMLAVNDTCRRMKLGSRLVKHAIDTMRANACAEVILETEVSNLAALSLYSKLGFIRDKRLFRYYLNGHDAYRLRLWLCQPCVVDARTLPNYIRI